MWSPSKLSVIQNVLFFLASPHKENTALKNILVENSWAPEDTSPAPHESVACSQSNRRQGRVLSRRVWPTGECTGQAEGDRGQAGQGHLRTRTGPGNRDTCRPSKTQPHCTLRDPLPVSTPSDHCWSLVSFPGPRCPSSSGLLSCPPADLQSRLILPLCLLGTPGSLAAVV